jgi:hypothetical protein
MTLSDAERVRMWPRVPDARCTGCGFRGECTWSVSPIRLACDGCREALGLGLQRRERDDDGEILRRARALYEANPSHAGLGEMPGEGTVCVVWAVEKAMVTASTRPPFAYEALYRAVGTLVPWNAKSTTAEVLAAFDRAIEASS